MAITGQATVSAAGAAVVDLLAAVAGGRTKLSLPRVVADPRVVGVPVGEFATEPTAGDLPRLAAVCLEAVRLALADAALAIGDVRGADVVVGTGSGCRPPSDWTMGGVPPSDDLVDLADRRCAAIGDAVRDGLGLDSRVVTINTACSSGLNAVAHGWGLVRTGRARRVVCIGADEFWAGLCFGFQAMGIVGQQPCSPFDRSVGTSLADGVGVVVLEADDVAASRGARWHAEVVGVGQSADAFHPSRPDPSGRGPAAAIDQALDVAGAEDGDVDVVVGHGTGTAANDIMERALHDLRFGERVSLVAAKGVIGHTHGASGLVELPLAVAAVAPISEPDGQRSPRLAMKNAWAMGGLNTSVLLRGPVTDEAAHAAQFASVELESRWLPQAVPQVERPAAVSRTEWARGDLLTKLTLSAVAHLLATRPVVVDRGRVGLAFATQRGPLLSWAVATDALRNGKSLNPALVPRLAYHAAASTAARLFDLRGPVVAYTSSEQSGVHALEHALMTLETGRADVMLVVAADEYTGPHGDGTALRVQGGIDVAGPVFAQLHVSVSAPDARPGVSAALLAAGQGRIPGTDLRDWCSRDGVRAVTESHDHGDQAPQVLGKLLQVLPGSSSSGGCETDVRVT